MKNFDVRQSEARSILQQLFPYANLQTLDTLLSSIDQSLQPPLRAEASDPNDLIVTIGPAVVANSVSGRNNSISFINNTIPDFTSGTVTFPSTDGGTITVSPGTNGTLTLPSGEYAKVLLSLDQSGNLAVTVGTSDPVLANTLVPSPTINTLPFAYLVLFNSGGTVQNIAQTDIYQFTGGGGGSGSGGGIAQQETVASSATSKTITFPTPLSGANYSVITQWINTTDTNPEFQPITITDKTASGFTATWNTPTDTANYSIAYIIPGVQQTMGEAVMSSGSTSVTVTLPIPLPNTSYVVVSELVNETDATPMFQPIVITNKTTTSFTAKVNNPLDTSNYRLAYQVALYQ